MGAPCQRATGAAIPSEVKRPLLRCSYTALRPALGSGPSLPAMSATATHPRLAARRARTRSIRLAIVALTVTLFLATWALIFGVLVSGHDPGLTAKQAGASSAATSSGSSSTASPSTSSSGDSLDSGASGPSSSGSSSSGSSSSGSAPTLSTHQS